MGATPIWHTVTSTADALIPKDVKPYFSGILRWQPGANQPSPFSTDTSVAVALAIYFVVIFGGQVVMANFKPMALRPLFVLHNIALSSGSAILLAMMAEEVIPIIYRDGWFAAICAHRSWTPRLYIFNYLFKYWELADTVFLVAKKKPLQFLHVFHHTATAVLCYTQLNGRTSVSWVPISLNLTVHVFMYYYYFVTAAFPGKKIWWKRYLTGLQISQFVIDLFVIYFASYSYFAAEYLPSWAPTYGSCAGTEGAAIMGCVLLSSYLVLFIAFYRKTYKSMPAGTKNRRRASSVAAIQAASGEGPSGGVSLGVPESIRQRANAGKKQR